MKIKNENDDDDNILIGNFELTFNQSDSWDFELNFMLEKNNH